MKKFTLQFCIVAFLTIPFIASAAWWNPLTWHQRPISATTTVQDEESTTTDDMAITTAPISSSTEEISSTTISVLVTPEPIIKTIIQEKIVRDQSLIDENNALRDQIAVLQASLNASTSQQQCPVYTGGESEPVVTDGGYKANLLENIQNEIDQNALDIANAIAGKSDKPGGLLGGALQARQSLINSLRIKEAQLQIKYRNAQNGTGGY